MQRHLLLFALAAMPACASEFSTFIGDNSVYHVARIQADGAGNTYIAGNRSSGPGSAAFVMKLNAAGNIVVFHVFSGKGTDTVNDLAVDASGNLYLAGATNSPYLPVRNAFQSTPGPGFVMKLGPDAEQVIFSTYFPAAIQALAIDSAGNVYVTGSTSLPSFPVTPGMPASTVTTSGLNQTSGAFVSKLAAAGDRILYSGRVSGSDKDCGCCSSCFLSSRYAAGVSIAVDPAGNAYVAGNTDTSNLPATTGALLATGTGAFVMKVNSSGTGLGYLTYIGAAHYPLSPSTNPANIAAAIAVDAAGNTYLAGATSDPQFPATKGAYQATFASSPDHSSFLPPTDAFALKLNASGTAVLWASYLGGPQADAAKGIALDGAGSVWVNGTTLSANFPNSQGWSQGGDFVSAFNASGSALAYSAEFPSGSASQSIAADGGGFIHVAGPAGLVSTLSASAPAAMRIFGAANAAYGPVAGQITAGELISIYGPHIGPRTPVAATADSTGALPTSLAGVQVLAVGAGPNQVPLTMLYASDSQINAVVPYSVYGSSALRIVQGAASSPDFPITVLDADPQIFRNADGRAVAVNQDGSINSADHPAPVGSIVSVWATGAGSYSWSDWGRLATVPRDTHCCLVSVSGVPAYVAYSGDAPGAVGGVVQLNFMVPAQPFSWFGAGLAGIVVNVDGAASATAEIYVSTGATP